LIEVLDPVVDWLEHDPTVPPLIQAIEFLKKELDYSSTKVHLLPVRFEEFEPLRNFYSKVVELLKDSGNLNQADITIHYVEDAFYLVRISPDFNFPFMSDVGVWVNYLKKKGYPMMPSQMLPGYDWSHVDNYESLWSNMNRRVQVISYSVEAPRMGSTLAAPLEENVYRQYFMGTRVIVNDSLLVAAYRNPHFLDAGKDSVFWLFVKDRLAELNSGYLKAMVRMLVSDGILIRQHAYSASRLITVVSTHLQETEGKYLRQLSVSPRETALYLLVKYQGAVLGSKTKEGKFILRMK
jgi:hypothetical protein